MVMDMYRDLELRRSNLERMQENGARLAKSTGSLTTSGQGEFTAGKPFMFELSFLNEPALTSGFALDENEDLVSGSFPVVTSGAYDWVYSAKGYYIGAFIFMVISSNTENYTLHHHFSFEGNAIKDFPLTADQAEFSGN